MENIVSVYKTGVKNSWSQKKMMLFLYGINLLFAYLVSLPFASMVERAVDHTVMADKLLQAFDFTALAILIEEYSRGMSLGWNIFAFATCYGLLHTFFNGGIIKILCSNMKFTFPEFITGCTEYFVRFFILLLITIGMLLLMLIFYLLTTAILDALTKNAVTEFWPFSLSIIKIFLFALILAWINMVLDYTKIIIVRHDFKSIVKALSYSLKFVWGNFARTYGIYVGLLIIAIGFLIIYLGIEQLINTNKIVGIFLFFIVTQIYILSRIWWRINYYYVQGAFYFRTAALILN